MSITKPIIKDVLDVWDSSLWEHSNDVMLLYKSYEILEIVMQVDGGFLIRTVVGNFEDVDPDDKITVIDIDGI
jgi:hypothetical protein